MFGHQDDQDNKQQDGSTAGAPGVMLPGSPPDPSVPTPPATTDEAKDVLSPAGGYPEAPSQRVHKGEPELPPEIPKPELKPEGDKKDSSVDDLLQPDDDLASIKIQALDELYPLIDKLDLSPDERFRTLMMMIQASDNQELIKAAFEAAHNIKDEKTKAQALLDIVNEINYFTQNPAA